MRLRPCRAAPRHSGGLRWRIIAKPGTYAVAPCFQHVLSIPASAADTERVNSCVNRVQMLHSANMKTETSLKLSYCNFNARSLRQRASRRQLLQPGHYALWRGSEPKRIAAPARS